MNGILVAVWILVVIPATTSFGVVGNLVWGSVMAVAWLILKLVEHSDNQHDREHFNRYYKRHEAYLAALAESRKRYQETGVWQPPKGGNTW
jgi:hypothetical protein